MNQQQILDILKAIRASLPQKEQVYFINIDDLLPLLRAARKLGYYIERKRRRDGVKLSIYLVYPDDNILTAPLEFYVDRTRTLERGKIYGIPREKLEPKRQIDYILRWRSSSWLNLSDFDWGKSDYTIPTID